MNFLIIVLVCSVGGFLLGVLGKRAQVAPVLLVVVGALLGLMAAILINSAKAMPVDIEAVHQPTPADYRPCSREAFSALYGDDRPLPPGCVLPLPLQPATVAPPTTNCHYQPLFKGMK